MMSLALLAAAIAARMRLVFCRVLLRILIFLRIMSRLLASAILRFRSVLSPIRRLTMRLFVLVRSVFVRFRSSRKRVASSGSSLVPRKLVVRIKLELYNPGLFSRVELQGRYFSGSPAGEAVVTDVGVFSLGEFSSTPPGTIRYNLNLK